MNNTNAERQRRFIARLKAKAAAADGVTNAQAEAELAKLKGEVARLTAENAQLRAAKQQQTTRPQAPPKPPTREELVRHAPPMPETIEEAKRLAAAAKAAASRPEAKIAALETKLKQWEARIAKLESENALQEEIAKRDRRIKALTTEVRNLKAMERIRTERHKDALATAGGMSFATQSAIAKCLHPDTRNHATEADKDKAFTRFTAWKADKDKAARLGKK